MTITLPVEEIQLVETIEAAVQRYLAPHADDIDRTASFPLEFYRQLGETGFFAAFVPEEFGGIKVSTRAILACIERIARVSAATALSFGNCGDAVRPIAVGGSDEVKQTVFPDIASGAAIPCFCLTEAESGSDAANMTTRATADGDHYILQGQKVYITNGSVGDYFTVFAKTSDDPRKGVSCFLVPRDAQGLSIGRDETLLGLRGMPATVLNFDNVRIPSSWRLGDEGSGFKLAMSALNEARLNISAVSLGVARRALDEAVSFARTRRSFGKPIIEHDGLGFLLADLATELAGAWTLFDRAVQAHEVDGESRSTASVISMAKLAATSAAMRITAEAVQIHGGGGLTSEYVVERLYRDAKAFQILDGTTQIQQLIIARHLRGNTFPYKELGW